ncbi:MAG: DnaA/Hda family protein [Pseudomonadota bacterium]
MARQLVFDLGARPALGRDDFLVSKANAQAVARLETTADWLSHRLLLTGDVAAGKTHLARIWACDENACVLQAGELAAPLPDVATVVDQADAAAGDAAAEEALFHLINHLAAQRLPLLLVARRAPEVWGVALPDLLSRLTATQIAEISAPDDGLLSALLVKHLADRQLTADPNAIAFIVPRMPRSYLAARELVRALDAQSLSKSGKITRAIAAEALASLPATSS